MAARMTGTRRSDWPIEYGLRLIAVDALEALGEAAAAADSSAEALRLLAAADRLRKETGYQWRFPGEQTTYDAALLAGSP